jgi:hypothetical protein
MEEKREVVTGLLRSSVDVNIIVRTSGLPVKEIESLKKHYCEIEKFMHSASPKSRSFNPKMA